MKPGKISIYHYFFAAALVALTALLFLWFFVFNKLIALKNGGDERFSAVQAAELKIKKNRDLESLFNNLKERENSLSEIIITKDKIIDLIKNIELYAAKANVELKIQSVQVPYDEHSPLHLKIETKGGFSQIYKFMEMVENAPYLSSFGRTSLQKTLGAPYAPSEKDKQKTEQIWILNADLNILSYKNAEF